MLNHDVPVNRLLKSTLHRLLAAPKLTKPLRQEIRTFYVRLADVMPVPVPNL